MTLFEDLKESILDAGKYLRGELKMGDGPLFNEINWLDMKGKISKYFTVGDATLLPSWGLYHQPSEEEKAQIYTMAQNMDWVRDFFSAPIKVHVWIRPGAVNAPGSPKHGEDYNAFVKGATHSAHKLGRAVDFHVVGVDCDAARAKLVPKLEERAFRMEDMPGGNWVHLDNMTLAPGGRRFFKV